MSFVMRRIDVTINLGQGDKGDEPGPDVTLSGYRCTAQITAALMKTESKLSLALQIWGLSADMLNRLTTTGPYAQEIRNNRIRVFPGDQLGMSGMAFDGQIEAATADYGKLPDVPLKVTASTHLTGAIKPVPASAFKDAVDVRTFMESKARQMGLGFEGNGVSVMLPSSYFHGTALDQVKACARAANIPYSIEYGVLAIWPSDGARQGSPLVISPETGLIGYPEFSGDGVKLDVLYNPSFSSSLASSASLGASLSSDASSTSSKAASASSAQGKSPATAQGSSPATAVSLGAPVEVRSSLGMANGLWVVTGYQHTLVALQGGAAGGGSSGGGGSGGGGSGGGTAGAAQQSATQSSTAGTALGWATQLTCTRAKNGK